ncbi:MAG: hypothetical protein M3Y08_19855 [Fibrobacterota bacterium]|nr:hypothetical protein [Fibrobacterota bacterium]
MSSEPLAAQFQEALHAVVTKFSDEGLTISEALGALDLVHAIIIRDALNGAEEEEIL